MDKKAKDILFHTYWSSKGWKDEHTTAPDDFTYAKGKGLMFDPFTIGHDDCVVQIVELAAAITPEHAARAFMSSLSTRRLDWRSGIGSWYAAKQLTPHPYTPVATGFSYEDGQPVAVGFSCQLCKEAGIVGRERYEEEDLNVLNFERIKWGGVRHGDLLYTLFDLEQLQKADIPKPTETDIAIFKGILSAAASCAPGDYPSALRDKLKDVPGLKTNQAERAVILELLACIGVLRPKSYDRPEKGKHDWHYVTCWRGEDGFDSEAVGRLFGQYL